MYRRQFFAAGAALAALAVQSVRAQALGPDCAVSFASGVLQLDPACVLEPSALTGMTVAPPAHLVAVSQAVAGGTGSPDPAAPQRGGRRQRAKARLRRRRHRAH